MRYYLRYLWDYYPPAARIVLGVLLAALVTCVVMGLAG